jgi:hypothetical protein
MYRIERIFSDYFFDFKTSNKWRERVLFSTLDGREFADDQGFDKVTSKGQCT